MKVPKLEANTVLILAAAGVALIVIMQAGKAAKEVVTGAADLGGGLLTGNNSITAGARSSAYQGAGIFGTLGAAADRTSGGILSQAGEWLGGKIADWNGY
jgi:hypothetical protein